MKKQMMLILLSCLVLLSLIGCSEDEPVVEIEEDIKTERASTLTISPSEFVKGDAEVLEAHFNDWQTGKVNLQYTGDEKMIIVSYDIYEQGEITKSSGTMGTTFKEEYDGKLLISLMDEDSSELQNYSLGIQMVDSGGSASSYYDYIQEIQIPSGAGRTIWGLNEEIILQEKDEAIVWAYLANKKILVHPNILTEEGLKRDYDFAFVIKVTLVDEEDYRREVRDGKS